jgi:hypothetical protein
MSEQSSKKTDIIVNIGRGGIVSNPEKITNMGTIVKEVQRTYDLSSYIPAMSSWLCIPNLQP